MADKWKVWRVGEVVSESEMRKQYGRGFLAVIGGLLESQPRNRREWTKYKIIGAMPKTTEEYTVLRNKRYTTSVDALVEDAFSEIEELAGEMREAYENTPDSFKEADVGSRRGEAADALEGLDRPELPDGAAEITTVFIPAADLGSRAKRAANLADMLKTASMTIRDYVENYEAPEGTEKKDFSDLEYLADELENLAQEVEGVEFPGMYG